MCFNFHLAFGEQLELPDYVIEWSNNRYIHNIIMYCDFDFIKFMLLYKFDIDCTMTSYSLLQQHDIMRKLYWFANPLPRLLKNYDTKFCDFMK